MKNATMDFVIAVIGFCVLMYMGTATWSNNHLPMCDPKSSLPWIPSCGENK